MQSENKRIPRPPGDFLAIATAALFLDRRRLSLRSIQRESLLLFMKRFVFYADRKQNGCDYKTHTLTKKPPKPLVISSDDPGSDDWIALAPNGLCMVLKFAARLAHLKPLD